MKLLYNDTSHSYWLDGKRVKSASKVAQIAADSFTIEQWQKRQVAIGMTLDRTLIERVAVDLDNREAIQAVCEDAANAAKANARAHRGTQRHRVFELLLLGREDQFVTDQQLADAEVLKRTLETYGLEPIPDRVEQFIAWPDHGVVGRYDAYLQHEGRPVLTDLKGGLNAVKYPHSTAVQMWLYRNAPHTSATIVRDGDKSEVVDWTTPPPDAAIDFGYVLYCDDHHDIGELWTIDLNGARTGGELALGIVDWRKQHNYGKELAAPILLDKDSSESQPAVEAGSLDQVADSVTDEATTSSVAGTTGRTQSSPQSTPPSVDAAATERRLALLARYRALNEAEQLAYCDLHIDPNNLDAVEKGLDGVDSFNATVEQPVVIKSMWKHPLPIPPDEGGPVSDTDVKALQKRFEALPLEGSLWTGRLVAEGKQSFDFRIKDRPTVRRYEIYRGILALAEWAGEGDEIIRAIIRSISEPLIFPDDPSGYILGKLDADQATRFARFATEFTTDRLALAQDEGTETLRIVAATTK